MGACGAFGWVCAFAGYAADGKKVKCPKCGKWYAAVTLDKSAAKVGEGRKTIYSPYLIRNADGSFRGFIEGSQQVSTNIIRERRQMICKFCNHTWTTNTTSDFVP